ncbi:MAG: type II toxin-antitoxin system YafQ family toxin [Fibrobacter sp.]|jgi:mRNA interferase YafQ|nr:type II toxin-antitoxin system YafQ family toxin [Fibrobacter sp.]
MKYEIIPSSTFKKDLKLAKKRGLNLSFLKRVIDLLAASDSPLPKEYKDHNLCGNYEGFRECHIQPDWLLIYKKNQENLFLYLTRTGSHSDLFKK